MKFGPVLLEAAEGCLLAHSLQGETRRVAKGTRLGAADLAELRGAGFAEVIAARLEAGDLHEDIAARILAEALAPEPAALGLRISDAGAGRVNLHATKAGITRVNSTQIIGVNGVDPMISVATVPDYHRVDADGMVATIKIISYAVPEAHLIRAVAQAAQAIRVLPPIYRSATLIETRVTKEPPKDKGRAAMAGRLDRMGLTLSDRVVVRHQTADIAEALGKAPGEVLFILTGSATSDPMDVAPEALRLAGGSVTRFGMPVDPGNLLFLGQLGRKPVIGLPGCARSPALNGADWVLERVICGLNVSSDDIAAMGVGGLLKEIPTRPRPRRPEDV
ncbi:molybdopterin-binding protein [Phaeobacter sp. HF9A]|uniref:molybdopterin-binding protein n=1 Tax=Phaeobacter sp. HF9A TaxID=2721561 RepID=UPI001431F56A|nr:molybdopterin-binding protein [Phaeobacter sp. HF9A]NIZ14214.1 molybdopterin-binding protein [Phaeobacter sp. HF9A]